MEYWYRKCPIITLRKRDNLEKHDAITCLMSHRNFQSDW